MAKKKSEKSRSRDVEIKGDLNSITKLLEIAQKPGKKRLKDTQIRTALAVSVGGVTKRVALRQRASDPGTRLPADRDPKDPIVIRCDQD